MIHEICKKNNNKVKSKKFNSTSKKIPWPLQDQMKSELTTATQCYSKVKVKQPIDHLPTQLKNCISVCI